MLEAGLLEDRYESVLAPVHGAFRALDDVYHAEAERLLGELYGTVSEVDAERLVSAPTRRAAPEAAVVDAPPGPTSALRRFAPEAAFADAFRRSRRPSAAALTPPTSHAASAARARVAP